MNSDISNPTPRIDGHPLLRLLVAFPVAYFTGALVTDIVYALTADMFWTDASAWMLAGGLVIGVLAAIVGIVDLLAYRHVRARRGTWVLVVGSLVVLILAGFNNLFHSRDAWTSVMPEGLTLSAVTVVAMLLTAWFGSERAYRVRVDRTRADATPVLDGSAMGAGR